MQIKTIKDEKWFPEYDTVDAIGRQASPVELLLLGALRVLGRGVVFEELFEGTFISRETHRRFFHKFVKLYAAQVYPRVVKPPANDDLDAIQRTMEPYAIAGFPGCFASVDVTHFWWELVPAARIHAATGKEGYATAAVQFAVNHFREILHLSEVFNGSVNDQVRLIVSFNIILCCWFSLSMYLVYLCLRQTITKYDEFVKSFHTGRRYSDVTFRLFNAAGAAILHKGLYLLCDNGYARTFSPICFCVPKLILF